MSDWQTGILISCAVGGLFALAKIVDHLAKIARLLEGSNRKYLGSQVKLVATAFSCHAVIGGPAFPMNVVGSPTASLSGISLDLAWLDGRCARTPIAPQGLGSHPRLSR